MADLRTWYPIAIMLMSLTVILSFIIAFAHTAYITKKHFNEILNAVKHSPNLYSPMKANALGGFPRKLFAVGSLYGALSSPRLLSVEYLSLKDIENFPPHLLRLLARERLLHHIELILFLAAVSLLPLKP